MRSRNPELAYRTPPCEITKIEAIDHPKMLYFVTVFEVKSKFRYAILNLMLQQHNILAQYSVAKSLLVRTFS